MSHGSNTQYISAVNARGAGKCWRAVGDPASVGWPWYQTRRNAFQYFDSTFDCFTLLLDLNHHLGQSHCGLWVWGRDQNHKRRGLKKVGMKLTVCVNQMIVLAIDPWNVFQVSYWLFFSSSELLLHPVTWKRQQRTSLTPAELQLSRVSLPTRFFKQFHFLYWNYQNLRVYDWIVHVNFQKPANNFKALADQVFLKNFLASPEKVCTSFHKKVSWYIWPVWI